MASTSSSAYGCIVYNIDTAHSTAHRENIYINGRLIDMMDDDRLHHINTHTHIKNHCHLFPVIARNPFSFVSHKTKEEDGGYK